MSLFSRDVESFFFVFVFFFCIYECFYNVRFYCNASSEVIIFYIVFNKNTKDLYIS